MRSRSEVNSGLQMNQSTDTSFTETAAVCQVLPQPIHPVQMEDNTHHGKAKFLFYDTLPLMLKL